MEKKLYSEKNILNSGIKLKWVAKLWIKYSFINLITLLVLDNAITHKTSKVKDKIKECEAVLSVIPSGLTWRLHR